MTEEKLDPVFRCDACQKLVRLETLHKEGCCPACGNRRVRNLRRFNDAERRQMIGWGLLDFVNQFCEVADGE